MEAYMTVNQLKLFVFFKPVYLISSFINKTITNILYDFNELTSVSVLQQLKTCFSLLSSS